MAFCSKCGTKIDDDAKFCSSCGEAVTNTAAQSTPQSQTQPQPQPQSQPQTQAQPQSQQPPYQPYSTYQSVPPQYQQAAGTPNFMDTPDYTAQYNVMDIQNNKGMGVIAYLGILFLIPMLTSKDSPFVRFHVNQGLVLFICEIGYYFITSVILSITDLRFLWGSSILHNIFSAIFGILGLIFCVFVIIGIINAANGKAKELPLIGKIRIYK